MIWSDWELAHVGLAVDNVDVAMETYSRALGAKWTEVLKIDHDWVAPLTSAGTVRSQGRAAWALSSNPPLELLDGPPGSIWHVPEGTQRLHHVAYWAEDLTDQSAQLQDAGFVIEYTMPPTEPGAIRGFAYHLHESGMRIELQAASDKPAMKRWTDGEPLKLEWGF